MQEIIFVFLTLIALFFLGVAFIVRKDFNLSVFSYIIAAGLILSIGISLLGSGIEKETGATIISDSNSTTINYTYINVLPSQDSTINAMAWTYSGFGFILLALLVGFIISVRKEEGEEDG